MHRCHCKAVLDHISTLTTGGVQIKGADSNQTNDKERKKWFGIMKLLKHILKLYTNYSKILFL